jgi:hypothetical protein
MPARAVRTTLLLLASAGPAVAQDFQNFQPAIGSDGYFTVESTRPTPHLIVSPSAWLNYGHEPVVRRDIEADVSQAVIAHQTTLHLGAAVGLGRFELALGLPVAYQGGEGLAEAGLDGVALGDARLFAKARLVGGKRQPFGLAVALPATLPIGAEDRFFGAQGFTATPTLITEVRGGGVGFALQTGARLRSETDEVENVEIGHELTWGLAGLVEPGTDFLLLIAEIHGSLPLGDVFDDDTARPVETLFGVRLDTEFGGLFTVGGGLGINPDRGVPTFRMLAGFSWRQPPQRGPDIDPEALLSDTDGDGVLELEDRCPAVPEDNDGFQDDDGCPDVDNDQDGISDVLDRCPDLPETVNGFMDADGCPDRGDADGDGIPDDKDRCPEEPEDKDGYLDRDGCLDPDNDEDEVPDTVDRCPEQPETKNGFADHDGCPDVVPVEAPEPKRKGRR